MSEKTKFKKATPESTDGRSARTYACDILAAVAGRDAYADKLLDEARTQLEHVRDRNLLTELVKGVLRQQRRLDWQLQHHSKTRIRKLPHAILAALRTALYQLEFMDKIPAHAAIHEAVRYVRRRAGERLTGFTNAVLRACVEKGAPTLPTDPTTRLGVLHSHPDWLVERWLQRFGAQECEQLLQADNLRPRQSLRVNRMRSSTEELVSELRALGLEVEPVAFQPDCIFLDSPLVLDEMAAFRDGRCTVQDAGAAAVIRLASPQAGWTVYDLCSAPGGKSTYAAELMNDNGDVVAVDLHANKLPLIHNAAHRLGLSCIRTLEGDARDVAFDAPADLVLVDAPCSGLGTLSGKPEIKWRRRPEDLAELATLQTDILRHAAALTAPGGVLVYSTCTTEPEENREVVDRFLRETPDFAVDRAENYLPAEICRDGALETLPHIHGCDGAFAMRLRRG